MQRRLRLRLLGLAFGVLMSIVLIGGIEFVLRTFDLGPELKHDPFAGFSKLVPMFERQARDDGVEVYRVHPGRGITEPREFLAAKPPHGFRAFVVGGSSAAGTPYPSEHAFSGWLQQYLERALPDRKIEVVNAAVTGYASRRIVAVTEELAGYEPDLLIIYSGHNERGERKFYAHLLDMDPRLFSLWEWASGSRVFALLSRAIGRSSRGTRAPEDIDFDELKNANQMFAAGQRDIQEGAVQSDREIAYGDAHYRFNLGKIIATAKEVGADVLILSLTQNYSDWPPGSSTHRVDLAQADEEKWLALVSRGDSLATTNCSDALDAWNRALAIDPEYADLHFKIAGCLRAQGHLAEAREHYRRASDLDRVLHGAPKRYNDILRDVAMQTDSLFLDIAALIDDEARRRGEFVGYDWIIDAMHPNIQTHQLIALAIAERLRDAGIPEPASEWGDVDRLNPSPDKLYAARPDLIYQEDLVRGISCVLALQGRCAEESARGLLAQDPDDPMGQKMMAKAREIIESQGR